MNAQTIPNMMPQPVSDKPCPSLEALKSGLTYFKEMYYCAPANDCKRTLFAMAAKQYEYFTGARIPSLPHLLPFANF